MSLSRRGGDTANCNGAHPLKNFIKSWHQDRSLQQSRWQIQQESVQTGLFSHPSQETPVDQRFVDEFLGQGLARQARPLIGFEFGDLSKELQAIQASSSAAAWVSDFMQQDQFVSPPANGHSEHFKVTFQRHALQDQWCNEFDMFQHTIPEDTRITQDEHEAFERAYKEVSRDSDGCIAASPLDISMASGTQELSLPGVLAPPKLTTFLEPTEALLDAVGVLLQSIEPNRSQTHHHTVASSPRHQQSNHDAAEKDITTKENIMVETNNNVQSEGLNTASEISPVPRSHKYWRDDMGHFLHGNVSSTIEQRAWAKGKVKLSSTSRHHVPEVTEHKKQISTRNADMDRDIDTHQKGKAKVEIAGSNTTVGNGFQQDVQRATTQNITNDYYNATASSLPHTKYRFTVDNPYALNPEFIDQVSHTTLPDTILALEAKVQCNTSDAHLWIQLGLCQQENERDDAAIAALFHAVTLDASLLDGWLALAASYINEGCHTEACTALQQWICNNDKYSHLLNATAKMTDDLHARTTNVYLKAARLAPGPELDPNVQVGLGILFHMAHECDKAVDCFKTALHSRPQDYMLWNKLGATLAGALDPVGAIEAYLQALAIKPSYVRARYNLAVSCISLGQNAEAAEHLLTCLASQQDIIESPPVSTIKNSNGNSATMPTRITDSIWDHVSILMLMMHREDLATQCRRRHLRAFRGEFNF